MKLPEHDEIPRRRRFAFGPATLIALLVVVALLYFWEPPPAPDRPDEDIPIVLDNEEGPIPDVEFLTERARSLHLTSEQRSEIRELEAEQKAKLAPVRAKLEKAAEEMNRELGSERGELPTGDAIGAASKDFADLSRRVNNLRESYWEKAVTLLSAEQRTRLSEIRRQEWRETLRKLQIGDELR